MFSYVTRNDLGRGREGYDEEADGMGFLFDDPGDEEVTFDTEPGQPFAFDGLSSTPGSTIGGMGQLIAEEQLERLDGGLGKGATTLEKNEAFLPPPPEGEKWQYKGPNPGGTGHDWETVPVETALAPAEPSEGITSVVRKHKGKIVLGALAAAIVGFAFWPRGA